VDDQGYGADVIRYLTAAVLALVAGCAAPAEQPELEYQRACAMVEKIPTDSDTIDAYSADELNDWAIDVWDAADAAAISTDPAISDIGAELVDEIGDGSNVQALSLLVNVRLLKTACALTVERVNEDRERQHGLNTVGDVVRVVVDDMDPRRQHAR
jgi:hypothetical protein